MFERFCGPCWRSNEALLAVQMLQRTQERLQGDVAHCAHEVSHCALRSDHAEMVAAIQEVAQTCDGLAQGREHRSAAWDAIASHSQELNSLLMDTQKQADQQV
jgi:hypothetical protein